MINTLGLISYIGGLLFSYGVGFASIVYGVCKLKDRKRMKGTRT